MGDTDFDISNIRQPLLSDADVDTMEQQEIKRFGRDTKLRGALAIWTMVIISAWLLFVLVLLFFIELDSNVAITLLATTTINVLGLPKIILEGLFTQGRKRNIIKNEKKNYQ